MRGPVLDKLNKHIMARSGNGSRILNETIAAQNFFSGGKILVNQDPRSPELINFATFPTILHTSSFQGLLIPSSLEFEDILLPQLRQGLFNSMAVGTSSTLQIGGSLMLLASIWGACIILLLSAAPSQAGVALPTKADIVITGACLDRDFPGYGSTTTTFGAINVFDVPVTNSGSSYFPGGQPGEMARLQGFAVPLFQDSTSGRKSLTLSGALVFGNSSRSFPAGARLNIQGTFEAPTADAAPVELVTAASIVGGTGPLRSARGFVVFEKNVNYDSISLAFYVFLAGTGLFPSYPLRT